MGAKTAVLAYVNGDAASALKAAGDPVAEGTAALIARVFPGCRAEPTEGEVLGEATYPQDGLTYAARFTGVDLVCDRHPVEVDPEWNEEPYALPFHPLELGNEALRAFFGFLLEGTPAPEDVDPDAVPLLGFRLVADSDGPRG
ncbi:hypothetical protein ACFCWY_19025 [Streptomyces sp. NPDC056362]|uniref:DUF6928 family protein n=1 Tax=unclassified Streptomyces TaxID=2593676 RepID=UPI0035E2A465